MTVMTVACCNSLPGLLIVDTDTGHVDQINDLDCRGVVNVNNYTYFLTKQGLHGMNFPVPGVEPTWCILSDIVNDWHGLLHHDNRLWGVDPVSDTIVEWDMTGQFQQRWHWKPDPNAGRLHTNDIAVDPGGRLWQCCFTLGLCREGQPQGYGEHRTPHSIAFSFDTVPYWCASNLGQVMYADKVLAEWPEAFTRGLCALDDGLVVGLSANRNGVGGKNGCLESIDYHGNHQWLIDLPTNEVYAIARVQGT